MTQTTTAPAEAPRNTSRTDVYLAEDGLLHCKGCGTPVQCRVIFAGAEQTVFCMCRCRKERRERALQQAKERERMLNIRRLKALGIQERHLLRWRFDTARDTPDLRMAKRYVEHWERARADNLGLLFWGDVGTGKTFLAACIANALLERAVPVLMTNFSKLLNQLGGMYSEERHQYISSLSHFPLLIIDDLGIERNTEYALEQVYAVVDERYRAGLPLIVTTNLTIREIRSPTDLAHARIYSRILELCTPVHIAGEDRRTAIGRGKQAAVKELLFPSAQEETAP